MLSKHKYFMLCTLHATMLELAKEFLETVVAKHRMPCKLILDHDLCLTSHFLHKLVSIISCEHALSTLYNPQTDRQSKYMFHSVK